MEAAKKENSYAQKAQAYASEMDDRILDVKMLGLTLFGRSLDTGVTSPHLIKVGGKARNRHMDSAFLRLKGSWQHSPRMSDVLRLLFAVLAVVLSVAASSYGLGTNNGTGVAQAKSAAISAADAGAIRGFTGGWGKGSGAGAKVREREFAFTAVVAKHNGDWDSSWEIVDSKILSGDLSTLLELMSKESKGKVQTDYRNIQAIALDSDEIFAIKPVFVYFSGSKDFILSESEVANLQKYVRLGGSIWGNSQSEGLSAFDTAFRREMKRVMPDKNKDFERISAFDPALRRNLYFADVKHYPEAAVVRYFGEIAIIQTAADISAKATTSKLSSFSQKKSAGDLQYGVNLIAYLLTRWEEKLRASPRL